MHYLHARFCLRVFSSFLSEKESYNKGQKCLVDMYLSPPPVFSHALSPKSMLYFRPSSLSFTSGNIDSEVGWGDLQHF